MNDDGGINLGQLLQKVPKVPPSDTFITSLHGKYNACKNSAAGASDTCESAAQFYVCLKNQQIGIDLRTMLA